MPTLAAKPAASEAVLTKAVLNAADKLAINGVALATVLGVSEATVSRMKSGDYRLEASRGRNSSSASCSSGSSARWTQLSAATKRSHGPGSLTRTSRSAARLPSKFTPSPDSSMSSPTWTPTALSSELRLYERRVWRLVEAQHHVSTLKIVANLAEQSVLEDLIEKVKPPVPVECRGLDWLLSTPFRYDAHTLSARAFAALDEPRASSTQRKGRKRRSPKWLSIGCSSSPIRP